MKHPLVILTALSSFAACAEQPTTDTLSAASTTTIAICHKGHTINVSQSAWPAHEAHGDRLGVCNVDTCSPTVGARSVVDFRADVGVTTDAAGSVSSWQDQSG